MLPKIVDHDARRRDFIEAAYETILEEGLAGTTIRAVAKRAGYTTGALVHYFADKEELIRHVLEENGKAVRERMLKAEQTLRGRPALRQVLLEALPTDKRSGSSWKIWLALWYRNERPLAGGDRRRPGRAVPARQRPDHGQPHHGSDRNPDRKRVPLDPPRGADPCLSHVM
jgi:AcrR family transcriptional regulator